MNILLLYGGTSNERDVSLRSGQAVANALDQIGYSHKKVDSGELYFNIEEAVNNFDLVFPVLHGKGGEDGALQESLEQLKIRFVGSGSKASKLCWNKWVYKKFLQDNNLSASEGCLVTLQNIDSEDLSSPFVLKPVEGGSSLDTIIARSPTKDDQAKVKELLSKYTEGMLFEPIIEGTEITVGVLGDQPLPVIEIMPPEGLEFDYTNKYNGTTRELCPPENVDEQTQQRAQELALKIHQLTGCKDMSRTDMIVDKSGNLHVLETNTIPGMTEQSLLPKMAATAGYSMAEFVDKLVKLAIS